MSSSAVSSWTSWPPAARSRNSGEPGPGLRHPHRPRPGQRPVPRHPVKQRRADVQLPDRPRDRQPFHIGDRRVPVVGSPPVDLEAAVAERCHNADGRPAAVVVLERNDQRCVRPQARLGELGPQPRRQQVLGVLRRLRRCAATGSATAPGTTAPGPAPPRPGRARPPAPPPAASRSSAPAAPSNTATPAATPPHRPDRRIRRRRPLDQQIALAVLQPRQRQPPPAPASAPSTTGAPSRPATAAAGPVPPSSASPPPRSSCDRTFHASSTAAMLTANP